MRVKSVWRSHELATRDRGSLSADTYWDEPVSLPGISLIAEAFQLDRQLANDCVFVTDLTLCRVLLMNDTRYPWLVLVPRMHGLIELADLDRVGQHRLLDEIHLADVALRQLGSFDKLNIAALGNVVSQLHFHVVARRIGDDAWPAPVWGSGISKPYKDATQTVAQLLRSLG